MVRSVNATPRLSKIDVSLILLKSNMIYSKLYSCSTAERGKKRQKCLFAEQALVIDHYPQKAC